MAKKRPRRRKPGLQRCSICGAYQLPAELEHGVCLTCLGRVAVKRWRPRDTRQSATGGRDAAEKAAAEAISQTS